MLIEFQEPQWWKQESRKPPLCHIRKLPPWSLVALATAITAGSTERDVYCHYRGEYSRRGMPTSYVVSIGRAQWHYAWCCGDAAQSISSTSRLRVRAEEVGADPARDIVA